MAKKQKANTEHATHDGEPPILIGREGDDLQTVTLDGGPGGGVFRVAEVPQTLISAGAMYTLSDRALGLYTWRHP